MICSKCGGTGEANMSNGILAWKVECDECCGSGIVAPLTEQEFIQTCDIEQLADVIGKIAKNAYQCGQNGKTNKCVNRHNCTGYCDYGWVEWLRGLHE